MKNKLINRKDTFYLENNGIRLEEPIYIFADGNLKEHAMLEISGLVFYGHKVYVIVPDKSVAEMFLSKKLLPMGGPEVFISDISDFEGIKQIIKTTSRSHSKKVGYQTRKTIIDRFESISAIASDRPGYTEMELSHNLAKIINLSPKKVFEIGSVLIATYRRGRAKSSLKDWANESEAVIRNACQHTCIKRFIVNLS